MTTIIILICMTLLVAGVVIVAASSKRSGQDGEKLKQAEKVLDNVKDANDAINRARSDKSISDRLRDKYGIK
jgi:cytochrome c-type biogenesis protein CcmH/NrfF